MSKRTFLISTISTLYILLATSFAFCEELEGRIAVYIVDHDNKAPEYQYRFQSKARVYNLKFSDVRSISKLVRKTGAEIKVSGNFENEDTFIAHSASLQNPAPKVASKGRIGGRASTGTRDAVVIIANFEDATVNCTASEIDELFHSAEQSIVGDFETSSRNQLTFRRDTNGDGNADIFGPFTIDRSAGSCTQSNYHGWGRAALAAAESAGVDFSPYQHRIFVIPRVCGFGGVAGLGCGDQCTTYILDCSLLITWVHELGHNFGMDHATRDANNDGTEEDEYGDVSCPMGAHNNAVLFNAPHTDQMGWLDAFSGKVSTVSNSSNYNLSAMEASSSSGSDPQIIKIQKASGEFYYLSYRTDSGTFDGITTAYRNKLNVHHMSTSDGKSYFITALDKGESFQDTNLGLTVCNNSSSGNNLNLAAVFSSSHDCDGADEPSGGSDGAVTGDGDGDGVTDAQETADGTNGSDPGSYQDRISSPVYTLWNSFLDTTNILELTNPDSDISSLATTEVTVSLYSIQGEHIYSQLISLAAGQQYDLILDTFAGFLTDSYGIIKVTFTGNLDGRLSYYNTNSDGGYEFAYSNPLASPLRGTTSVSFNTFQPSSNPSEQNYLVYNWLTIVNVASTTKTFTINSYNQAGELITSRTQTIAGLGRADIDGGHGLVGPSVVGFHEIVPGDGDAPYLALLTRYGTNVPSGSVPTGYFYAFPLSAHAGNGEEMYLPISRQFGEANWVELINTTNSQVSARLDFYDSEGNLTTVNQDIAARSQFHYYATDLLDEGERGYVKITPNTANSILTQSMLYYRNQYGSMYSMTGITPREALGSSYGGSYNLFLNAQNWLTISNISNAAVAVSITSSSSDSSTGSHAVNIAANSSVSVPIHDTESLNARADTYGYIEVEPDAARSLIVDLHRIRYVNDDIDFAFPTAVRAQ